MMSRGTLREQAALEPLLAHTEIAAAILALQHRFSCRDGTHAEVSPSGEEYVILDVGGIRQEATPMVLAPTRAEAVARFLAGLEAYAAGKSGRLYWRVRPEIFRLWGDNVDGWYGYARLLITNKPAMAWTEWHAIVRPIMSAEEWEGRFGRDREGPFGS